MRSFPTARPAFSSAATLLLVGCDFHRPVDPDLRSDPSAAVALSTYFPPPEANGGWRTTTDAARIRGYGVDGGKLKGLGQYLMSLPYENYAIGVSGYKPSNKAAIVVKNGWIVGEYYNQAGAKTGALLHGVEWQDLRHAARRAPGPDLPGARPRVHQQAVRPPLAPAGIPPHRQPQGRHHLRPGVPPRIGHHPGGSSSDRQRGVADRGETGSSSRSRSERMPTGRRARGSPTPRANRRPTPRAARTRAWRSTT